MIGIINFVISAIEIRYLPMKFNWLCVNLFKTHWTTDPAMSWGLEDEFPVSFPVFKIEVSKEPEAKATCRLSLENVGYICFFFPNILKWTMISHRFPSYFPMVIGLPGAFFWPVPRWPTWQRPPNCFLRGTPCAPLEWLLGETSKLLPSCCHLFLGKIWENDDQPVS